MRAKDDELLTKLSTMKKNNLKQLIRLAGLSHAEVAEKKGIAPESLSRHISGRSQFSIQDAEDYAEILDIDPSQLLFPNPEVKIYGKIIDSNVVVMNDTSDPEEWISTPFRYPPHVGVILDKRETFNNFMDGAMLMIDIRPIQKQNVPQTAFGKNSIVKTDDGKILQRAIFPSYDGKFTLVSLNGAVTSDINLKFACPVLMRVERPELLGFQNKS
tara:strand:+ start:23234 stop:23878 length:645 start_codon:yes stop_codon:yes gene_type:complete